MLVALPTVLMDEKHALQMCRKLSILYLANADMPLDFLLLSDFTDAQAAHAEGDERILSALTGGVARSKSKYGPRFYCLHRARSRKPAPRAAISAGSASAARWKCWAACCAGKRARIPWPMPARRPKACMAVTPM